MKLSVLVAVLALSSEALSACANTWQKCKPGDANMCECQGSHIMKCLPSFPHHGKKKLVFAYRKLYVCPKNWHLRQDEANAHSYLVTRNCSYESVGKLLDNSLCVLDVWVENYQDRFMKAFFF
ncbi:hypothetical protein SNK04_005801 [Fusarium graminearum]